MRVAIIHDWLVTYAGSERVVEQLLTLFPQADVFSLLDFLPPRERAFLRGKVVQTSFLQRLPLARRWYSRMLPLMPLAIEQFNLSRYDLVISSSHCVAKGVVTRPEQLHLSYVHTPMRYAWDLQHEYLERSGLHRGLRGVAARWMLHKLRMWDAQSAHGVDALACNSHFIARRIWKTYRREAQVIYPPVDVETFALCPHKEDFYLTASRLVPYKRVELLIEAFRQLPDRRLIVLGDGPELARLRAAAGHNVSLVGYQDGDALRDRLQRARAFLFASHEDFGIVLVEAQACGTPVIAFGQGGALETIRGLDVPQPTGMFFAEQSAPAIVRAIREFESIEPRFEAANCRANALRFSVDRFNREFLAFAIEQWKSFSQRVGGNVPADFLALHAGLPAVQSLDSRSAPERPSRAA